MGRKTKGFQWVREDQDEQAIERVERPIRQMEKDSEHDLELLARGVNPMHGSLDPKLMATKVFEYASTDEKVKIRKLFVKAGVVMVADAGPEEILHVLQNGNDPRNALYNSAASLDPPAI